MSAIVIADGIAADRGTAHAAVCGHGLTFVCNGLSIVRRQQIRPVPIAVGIGVCGASGLDRHQISGRIVVIVIIVVSQSGSRELAHGVIDIGLSVSHAGSHRSNVATGIVGVAVGQAAQSALQAGILDLFHLGGTLGTAECLVPKALGVQAVLDGGKPLQCVIGEGQAVSAAGGRDAGQRSVFGAIGVAFLIALAAHLPSLGGNTAAVIIGQMALQQSLDPPAHPAVYHPAQGIVGVVADKIVRVGGGTVVVGDGVHLAVAGISIVEVPAAGVGRLQDPAQIVIGIRHRGIIAVGLLWLSLFMLSALPVRDMAFHCCPF